MIIINDNDNNDDNDNYYWFLKYSSFSRMNKNSHRTCVVLCTVNLQYRCNCYVLAHMPAPCAMALFVGLVTGGGKLRVRNDTNINI